MNGTFLTLLQGKSGSLHLDLPRAVLPPAPRCNAPFIATRRLRAMTKSRRRGPDHDAEVIVVGAGPAGSTAAPYRARAGIDVLLLEKTVFPREKVCGDGLTPRGVKQLIDLGIDTSEEAGWVRSRGLRILTGDLTLELDWPDLTSYPPYGVSRTRQDFDDLLAKTAVTAGGRVDRATTGPPAV